MANAKTTNVHLQELEEEPSPNYYSLYCFRRYGCHLVRKVDLFWSLLVQQIYPDVVRSLVYRSVSIFQMRKSCLKDYGRQLIQLKC